MKTISYDDLNSLYKWMEFIVSTKEAQLLESDVHLKVFDDNDSAYLVVNQYHSELNSTEYYFKPKETTNGLAALVHLLERFDFSLQKVLTELPNLNYADEGVGPCVSVDKITIFREHVTSN